jgi:CBS-domain-containing membrane protein
LANPAHEIPTAADMMTRNVVTLQPAMSIYEAMRVLLKKKISGAPVVDEKGEMLGILSEKDCFKVLTAEAFDGVPEGCVRDFMSADVVTVKPDASIFDIVALFLRSPFRRVPVMDESGRLAGQISRRDVLSAIDSIRDNSYLFGSAEFKVAVEDAVGGVDSAMRRARQER